VIIGGGIIGTATAMALQKESNFKTLIIEAEDTLANHQTGNNSGVIHSGLYYKPGSLKANNCTTGRILMYRFCEEHNIPHEKCGKIVVAVNQNEINPLNDLYERGLANGLNGIKKLNAGELKEYEPYVNGVAGLYVPQTGILDYRSVTEAYSKIVIVNGGELHLNCKFKGIKRYGSELVITTSLGDVKFKYLINCGGLYSDRIAKLCGVKPALQIIPFRGEYYKLTVENTYLVKNLIYPVPDPKFPFLGVHFTRMIKGGVEAGPNAVLAFKREGYSHADISIRDTGEMLFYPGFWKMASKYYKTGFAEFYRSLSKKAFVSALKKLVPEIEMNFITEGGAGVRAQALEPSGKLVDDFRIVQSKNMIHVLNAPSPAATASISIGNYIADLAKHSV
jgi:L-2-hydroxyglutarate oxidase